jgi:hypothetical protein
LDDFPAWPSFLSPANAKSRAVGFDDNWVEHSQKTAKRELCEKQNFHQWRAKAASADRWLVAAGWVQ